MNNKDSLSNEKKLDRRDFFRKTAALSATALAGTSIFAADDDAIMKTPE